MVVVWVMEPEVAMMVTIWAPAGATGLGVGVGVPLVEPEPELEPEQPMTRPVAANRSTIMPRSRKGFPLSIARLRKKISIEPNGIRNAAAMMDAP